MGTEQPPPQRRDSTHSSMSEHSGVPLRHPRPMTTTEMYMECEKEQEAVVNRLTRELAALRAQSASVASNVSMSTNSTSASLLPVDITDPIPTHQITGATHPTPIRRDRSSSSASARSSTTPCTSAAGSTATNISTQVQAGSTASIPLSGHSQASADRVAAAGPPGTRSRQHSTSASATSTPARQSSDHAGPTHALSHRPSSTSTSTFPRPNHPFTPGPDSPTNITTPAYAETATYRSEMEIVRAENAALRNRVRALERALASQQPGPNGRRRGSSSTSDIAVTGTVPAAAGIATQRSSGTTSSSHGSAGMSATSPRIGSPETRAEGVGVAAWAAGM